MYGLLNKKEVSTAGYKKPDDFPDLLFPVIAAPEMILSHVIDEILLKGYTPVLTDPKTCNILPDLLAGVKFEAMTCPGNLQAELIFNSPPQIIPSCSLKEILPDKPFFSENIIFLTSGSDNKPKFIIKTTANLLSEADILLEMLKLTTYDHILGSVPLCHIYGFLFSYILPFNAKTELTVITYLPDVIKKLNENIVTVWVTVPSVLKAVLPFLNEINNSLKMIILSGSRLDTETAQKAVGLTGAKIIEIYGSTETGGIGFREPDKDSGYCLLTGVEVEIKNDPENPGRILIKSPYVSKNQLINNKPETILSTEGFFASNDIGMVSSGLLFLDGRADRIVKIREKRVNLNVIEDLLLRLDFIKEVCIIPVSVEQQTELAGFISGNAGIEVKLIRQQAAGLMPWFMVPDIMIIMDELPKLPNGKFDYRLLKEKFKGNGK